MKSFIFILIYNMLFISGLSVSLTLKNEVVEMLKEYTKNQLLKKKQKMKNFVNTDTNTNTSTIDKNAIINKINDNAKSNNPNIYSSWLKYFHFDSKNSPPKDFYHNDQFEFEKNIDEKTQNPVSVNILLRL